MKTLFLLFPILSIVFFTSCNEGVKRQERNEIVTKLAVIENIQHSKDAGEYNLDSIHEVKITLIEKLSKN